MEHTYQEARDAATHHSEPDRDLVSRLIAGTGYSSAAHHEGSAHRDDKTSVLDKLTHKEERQKKAAELAEREAQIRLKLAEVAHEKKENEGLIQRIRDHFENGKDGESADKPEHKHELTSKLGFLDNLTGKKGREERAAELEKQEAQLQMELAQVEHDKEENEGILQRIKDHLDGHDDSESEPQGGSSSVTHPTLLDKLTGKAAEEERRRKEEEQKSAFDKMKDRINDEMGGGAKAKQNDDLVDKAVDLVQEHILHEGDQSHESLWERKKDEEIAKAVRHQLHLKEHQ